MRKVSNKFYHQLLGHYRWRDLRARYLGAHPLCEECERKGRTTLATCVHHVRPVESQPSQELMIAAAYDWNNLEALCDACHELRHAGHTGRRSKVQTRESARQTAEAFLARWCRLESDRGE